MLETIIEEETYPELELKFLKLKQWVTENGGYVSYKLSISNHEIYGRCLVLNKDACKGEILIKIPYKLILNESETNFPNINDSLYKFSGIKKNILYLISEKQKKEESFYKEYINLLPNIDSFHRHPIYLFHYNKFPNISERLSCIIESKHKIFTKFYNRLIEYNKNYKILKYENIDVVLVSYLQYLTRYLSETGLIPVIDMLTHSYNHNSVLDKGETSYILKTCSDIKNKDICTIDYNCDNLLKKFTSFGFIDEKDCYDKIYLEISLGSFLSNLKMNKLFNPKEFLIREKKIDIRLSCEQYRFEESMQSFRMASIDINNDSDFKNKCYNRVISYSNEIKSLKLLQSVLDDCKMEVDNEIYSDKEFSLDKLDKFSIEWNCIKFVNLVKNIIEKNSLYIENSYDKLR